MMRRRAVLPPLVALVLAVCAAPPRPAGTVVYASGTDLESANPLVTIHNLSRQVQRYVLFVTLARLDSTLRPTPYYAQRWEWSEGGRAVTLHLDPALRWHDGRPTTAADVVFTVDAARDPATGYPRYADLADVTAVSAIDDTTARIEFAGAQADLPLIFSELPILPKHLLGGVPRSRMREAAFNLAPVGNGPFRFISRTAGQRWLFERWQGFPQSLGGPPRAQRLVITVVDEPTTKFAGLVSGELDVAGISPTMASLAERDQSVRVLSYPVLFSNVLVFNASRPPFDDLRVRRAVSALIDRDRIVQAALAGYGTPATGPVPPASPLAVPARPPSAHAGDSLLDAAGWRRGAEGWRARGGRPLAFTVLTVGSGDNAVEQLLQADLREHGVRVEVRQVELGAFLEAARARTKTFDALLTGIPGDIGLSYLSAMFDSRLAGGALDYAGFHTSRLDSLFVAARTASAADSRHAAWARLQQELDSLTPVAWLYHSRGVQGLSRRLDGVTMDLRGELVTSHEWRVGGA